MAEKNGFYKCNICGNLVEVVEAGQGNLVCCGEEMNKLEEKWTENEGNEKHVPVVKIEDNKIQSENYSGEDYNSVRELRAGIIMSLDSAKQINKWLKQKIIRFDVCLFSYSATKIK